MANRFWWLIFFLVSILLLDRVVFAVEMTVFDFDQVPTNTKHHTGNYLAIESYMEALYGSDVTVSQGTRAVTTVGRLAPSSHLGNSDMSLTGALGPSISSPDAFLRNGKGKNAGVVMSFASPINSFAVDWQVFKRGSGIIIKADGVVIYQDLLTKVEKKTGIMDHLDPVVFDHPVQTLEFIGLKRSKIGIDNLTINIPSADTDSGSADSEIGSGGEGGNQGNDYSGGPQAASVPEPSTLILFGFGLLALGAFVRRMTPATPEHDKPSP